MTVPARPFRVAVIPTRDRHQMVADCIDSVRAQVDAVYVIDNRSIPPIDPTLWPEPPANGEAKVLCARYDLDPPNISNLWNVGVHLAEQAAFYADAEAWDIIVLNSDVIVPPGWVDALSAAMRDTTAALAFPDQSGGTTAVLHTEPGPVPLAQRVTGYAYMLRGEAGLRLDESMAWWYSDDDLDWTARGRGGSLLVPGIPVQHLDPNGSMRDRPELHDQAAADRQTFITKWGRAPH
ncbi:glycosyltransferase family 2 protein [Streptomyces uncialis]|uniref:glycosyltransferase family 2 protein n=1 Tax=Streptomyces uncialis TaxID=1048205 RepID=UPI00364F90AD